MLAQYRVDLSQGIAFVAHLLPLTVYDQCDAEGFIKLNALRLRLGKRRAGL